MSLDSLLVAFGLCMSSDASPQLYGEFRVVEEFYVGRYEAGTLFVESYRSDELSNGTSIAAHMDYFMDNIGNYVYHVELTALTYEGDDCSLRIDTSFHLPFYASAVDLADIDAVFYVPFSSSE